MDHTIEISLSFMHIRDLDFFAAPTLSKYVIADVTFTYSIASITSE